MLSTGKTVFSILFFILFGIKTPHKLLFLPPFGRKWWQEKRNVIRFDCAFFPTTSERVLAYRMAN